MKRLTIKQKADLAGVSATTIKTWQKRADWPGDDVSQARFMTFAKKRLADAAKAQTGENVDLKRLKLQRQCDLLTQQIRRAAADAKRTETAAKRETRDLIPLRDAIVTMNQFFDEARTRIEMWSQTAMAKHPQLRTEILRTRDAFYAGMQDAISTIQTDDDTNEKETTDDDN